VSLGPEEQREWPARGLRQPWAEITSAGAATYFASRDAGRTWVDVGEGLGKERMLVDAARTRSDPATMAALSERGITRRLWSSRDGGAHWKLVKLPAGAEPNQVVAGVGPGVLGVFVVGQPGEDPEGELPVGTTLYRSTDGGETWAQQHLGGSHQAAAVLDDGRWYWSGSTGLMISTDDGVTFTACGNLAADEIVVDRGEVWFLARGTVGKLEALGTATE
jgi:hypothetical protein